VNDHYGKDDLFGLILSREEDPILLVADEGMVSYDFDFGERSWKGGCLTIIIIMVSYFPSRAALSVLALEKKDTSVLAFTLFTSPMFAFCWRLPHDHVFPRPPLPSPPNSRT